MSARFVYVVGQLRAGGLERQLHYLLLGLNKEKHRPLVVVWNFDESEVYVPMLRRLGVPIMGMPKGMPSLLKLIALRRLVRRLRPELVHSCSFFTNFAVFFAALGTQIPTIGSVRSNYFLDRKSAGLLLGTLCARWPRTQIFNSAAAYQNARASNSLFRPRRIEVVRNGLEMPTGLTANPSRAPFLLASIGSLIPIKRWDRLLTLAKQLRQRGYEFTIQVAGEGPLKEALIRESQQLDVADQVKFIGYVSDVGLLLRRASLLVHVSDAEGCPNVVMEAMAHGRPVVATDAGEIQRLVDDGITGYVVNRGDENALVDRVGWLLDDASLCDRMGKAGRAKAELKFGLNRLMSETLKSYEAAGWRDAAESDSSAERKRESFVPHGLSEISGIGSVPQRRVVQNRFDKAKFYLRNNTNIAIRAVLIRQLLSPVEKVSLIDLGCGSGEISLQFQSSSNHLTLVDLSAEMLTVADRNANKDFPARFVHSDILELDTDTKYDIVLCIGVLAHVTSIDRVICKVSELLRPCGKAVFQITDGNTSIGKVLNHFYSLRGGPAFSSRYVLNTINEQDLMSQAEANGLKLIDRRRYFPQFPGMGKFPYRVNLGVQRALLNRNFTLEHGPDLLLLFQKKGSRL